MGRMLPVSDACQINDLDHLDNRMALQSRVSDACQINDLDHKKGALYK